MQYRGGQPAAHWTVIGGALQLGKIFQMKNIPQLISSYIRGGQPVADCTLISCVDLSFREQLGFSRKSKREFFPALTFFFFLEQLGFSRKNKNLENFFQC